MAESIRLPEARDLPIDIYLRLSDARRESQFEDREPTLRARIESMGRVVGKVITENDFDPETGKPKPATAWKTRNVRTPSGMVVRMVIRPGFRELLDRATHGISGGFIAEDIDRFCRQPRDLEDLIDVCRERKASALSLSGSLHLTDGGTTGEITMARGMVAHAWASSEDTARRVRDAAETRARKGLLKGSIRRFGFEDDGRTIRADEAAEMQAAAGKVLSLVPERGKNGKIKLASLRGPRSLSGIVRDLNRRKVPTVRGGRWTVGALNGILRNPANAGIATYKGEIVMLDAWPGIFTAAQHEALAAVLSDEGRRTNTGRTPVYLLSGGGFTCDLCGGRISSAGAMEGESRTYGCRGCLRLSIKGEPADMLAEMVMRRYLEQHHELERPTRVTVLADNDEKIGQLEDQADEILVDKSRPRAERMAEVAELERQIRILKAAPAVVYRPGRAEGIIPAAWDTLDRYRKREIIGELFHLTLLPAPKPGRTTFDPARIRFAMVDGTPEQDAWLAACVAEAGADLAARLAIPRGPRGPQARHEISCLNCGKQVLAGNSRAKFCDQRCRYAYRRDHPAEPWERDKQRTCEVCGETFLAAKSTARYCPAPKDCTTRAYRKRYEDRKAAGLVATEAKVYRRQCVMCRETFDTSKPGAKYCGDRCRTAGVRARRQAGLTVPSPARGKRLIHQRTCEVCGAGFMSAKPDGRFCSDNCRAKAHYQANRTAILAQRARVWSERKAARLSS